MGYKSSYSYNFRVKIRAYNEGSVIYMFKKAFEFMNLIFAKLGESYTMIIRIILLPWILFLMLIKRLYEFVFEKDA
jgi:hypothetical protein